VASVSLSSGSGLFDNSGNPSDMTMGVHLSIFQNHVDLILSSTLSCVPFSCRATEIALRHEYRTVFPYTPSISSPSFSSHSPAPPTVLLLVRCDLLTDVLYHGRRQNPFPFLPFSSLARFLGETVMLSLFLSTEDFRALRRRVIFVDVCPSCSRYLS